MLRPIAVELVSHDPRWAEQAVAEADRLATALGPIALGVEHIGSTAIPGIHAKPIIDLLAAVSTLTALDARRLALEGLGYAWHGENGLVGRRYCTLSDQASGRRRIQLHCFAHGSPDIARHVAFRDHLRARPALAAAYDAIKRACRDRHPHDSYAYSDCKGDWIRRIEAAAVAARP